MKKSILLVLFMLLVCTGIAKGYAVTLPLIVSIDGPALVFATELVKWVITIAGPDGQPANATYLGVNSISVAATLVNPDNTLVGISPVPVPLLNGVWAATWTATATPGFYSLVVQIKTSPTPSAYAGFATKGFEINPTLKLYGDSIAVINTKVGVIYTNMTVLTPKIIAIDGKVAWINTTLGIVLSKLDTINARIVAVNGTVFTIKTDVGTIKTSTTSLNVTILNISDKIISMNSTVGGFDGEIVGIRDNVAYIRTQWGTLTLDEGVYAAALRADGMSQQSDWLTKNAIGLVCAGMLVAVIIILLVKKTQVRVPVEELAARLGSKLGAGLSAGHGATFGLMPPSQPSPPEAVETPRQREPVPPAPLAKPFTNGRQQYPGIALPSAEGEANGKKSLTYLG